MTDPIGRKTGDEFIGRGGSMPTRSTGDPAKTRAFAVEAAMCLRDDKCTDIVVLDVREASQITDYIVIGTGTSDRQMHAALASIDQHAGAVGFPSMRRQSDDRSTWLLGDYVDVVVHLFEPETREHYDLEMMWGGSARVKIPDGPGPLAGRKRPGAQG